MGARTGIERVAESGSARVRWPKVHGGVPEAVIINTAGGIAAGDLFATEIALGEGAALVATTAAAEKVYKSEGETARIDTRLTLADGAELHWIPQEAILFDRARLVRVLDVDMAAGATLLAFEATVFGRAAHAERMESGLFQDRWRVRRGGRLVFADSFRLAGTVAAQLDRPMIGGGHRALATLLYVAPDAPARIEAARAALDGSACECGASAVQGCLVVRWLGPGIGTLRRDAARFMTAFRGGPLPRVWQC